VSMIIPAESELDPNLGLSAYKALLSALSHSPL